MATPLIGATNLVSLGPLSPSDLSEAKIDTASSGDNAVVAGVAGQIIRVYAMFLTAAGAVTVQPGNDVGGSFAPFTGVMSLATGVPLDLQYMQYPYFTGTAGKAFNLKLGGAVQISGRLYYLQG